MLSDKVMCVAVVCAMLCYIANVLTLKADGIVFGSCIGAILLILGIKGGYNASKAEQIPATLEGVNRLP